MLLAFALFGFCGCTACVPPYFEACAAARLCWGCALVALKNRHDSPMDRNRWVSGSGLQSRTCRIIEASCTPISNPWNIGGEIVNLQSNEWWMCFNMRAWCRYTRGRCESTHGFFPVCHTTHNTQTHTTTHHHTPPHTTTHHTQGSDRLLRFV